MAVSVLLVGCGKMGRALLEGWLEQGIDPAAIVVVEPNAAGLSLPVATRVAASLDAVPPAFRPDVVVLAVKPQSMDQVAPACRRFVEGGALFLSIAAGKTLGYFARLLGGTSRVVRSMPNTPAAVRRGITVAVAGPGVTAAERARAEALLQAVGEVVWSEDESQLDAVTALSGGGPAYVFLLVEVLARAGVAAGLPADMAMRLARVTVAGSGELLHRSTESAEQLRQNVTSPGGTTLEALKVLMAPEALQPLFDRAIAAATARSRELAG